MSSKSSTAPSIPAYSIALVVRLMLFALTWWVIAEGQLREPLISLSCILIAAGVSVWLWPPLDWRWNALHILRFIPWFLWNSILGGVDVARRAFKFRMDLNPGIIEIKSRLTERPRLLFIWTVSLLPGTASISLEGETVYIHALDVRVGTKEMLRELERRLGRLLKS